MFTKVTPATNDANACFTPGMYHVGENWSNTPVNYGILIVFKTDEYIVQLFRCVVACQGQYTAGHQALTEVLGRSG